MFSHLYPEKIHKCVLKASKQCLFFQDDRFEGSHVYVYSKNECFPIYLLQNHINVCWNPQNRARVSETIDLRGHMPRFTLKMNIFHLYPEKPHKCVLKPSEQGLFFQDDWFEGSHAWVYSKNEHFPSYLLRNTINLCWNPQNRARFSETIDLRGHMPRFTLKMNVFPSISWETP